MRVGHQGLYHDPVTDLVYNRRRMLHTQLGRFTARDPLGYEETFDLYEYLLSAPGNWLDPAGRQAIVESGRIKPLPDGAGEAGDFAKAASGSRATGSGLTASLGRGAATAGASAAHGYYLNVGAKKARSLLANISWCRQLQMSGISDRSGTIRAGNKTYHFITELSSTGTCYWTLWHNEEKDGFWPWEPETYVVRDEVLSVGDCPTNNPCLCP
jgi:RHS repeat-associated protein